MGILETSLVHLTDQETSKLLEQILTSYFKVESPESNSVPGIIQLVTLLGLTQSMNSSIS
jgi:hypothetical protein